MKNADKSPREEVHMLIALRRRKDNATGTARTLREIIYDEDVAEANLINRCLKEGGVWRIHKTVNARNVYEAMKIFQHKYVESPEYVAQRLPSVWKTSLMNSKCKATRLFMLDIDNRDCMRLSEILQLLKDNKVVITQDIIKSPNGWHLIIDKCDTRLFHDMKDVTVIRDGYSFKRIVNSQPSKFDESLKTLLEDDTPRTNAEFKEFSKLKNDDSIDINDVKMHRQPLI